MDRFANNTPMKQPEKHEYDERDLWFGNLYERSHNKPLHVVSGRNKHHIKFSDYYRIEKPTFNGDAHKRKIKNHYQIEFFAYKDKINTFKPEEAKKYIRVGKATNNTIESSSKPIIYSKQRIVSVIKDKPLKTYIKQK